MRYVFACGVLLSTACARYPQVGDCYIRTLGSSPTFREFDEYIKIIRVDKNTDEIEHVYNHFNDKTFKKGRWYTCRPLTIEDKYWFNISSHNQKKVNCPW